MSSSESGWECSPSVRGEIARITSCARWGSRSANRGSKWSLMRSDAVESVLTEGVGKAMARFNRRVTPGEENAE